MDLKSKRILEISQIVICLSMLFLYTRIGGMGTVYVAITMEIIAFFMILLFGGVSGTICYRIQLCETEQSNREPVSILKGSGLYCILATVITEAALFAINYFLIEPSEILYVGSLLKFSMILIPLFILFQWLKGIMQALFQPQIGAFADLIFWLMTAIFTFLSFLILGNYGKKAADLMQSIKLEHFYVILSLVPGFLLGSLGAILFLGVIGWRRKDEVALLFQQPKKKSNVFMQCISTFTAQIQYNIIPLLQKLPIWILLILSLKEIESENYLFGHLYGAVLPVLLLLWSIFDLSLVTFKKRLYALNRKRMQEQYYKELKTVLVYVLIHSVFLFVCVFSLHKPFLAIWSMQTSSEFMMLMKAASVIALLGFPYMVLTDLLKEKNANWECTISVFFGAVMSLIVSAICNKFLGAGNILYILSLSLGLLVTIVIALWFMSSEVGINYLSVLLRSYKLLIVNVFIGVLLVILQSLIFTAFGGLGTLVICVLFSYLMFWISIRMFRVFSKEERKLLSFFAAIKSILQISR